MSREPAAPSRMSAEPVLAAALETCADPVYAIDREGRIVFCNQAFATLIGERRERIVGRLSLLLYPPEVTPVLLMRRIQGLLGRDVPETFVTEIRLGGGAHLPVELTASSLKRGEETIGRAIVVRPVGATAKRREQQPKVESLFHLSAQEADALPYGLIMLDAQGVVTGYNDAESRLSGYAPNRVIGRNFFTDIAPCTRVRGFAGLYRQMVETGEPPTAQFDFLFRLPHGEKQVAVLMAYFRPLQQGVILVDQAAPTPAREAGAPSS